MSRPPNIPPGQDGEAPGMAGPAAPARRRAPAHRPAPRLDPPARRPGWARPGIQIVLLAAITLAAYYPVLTSGFIWDDDDYVLNNRTLRTAAGLWDIWFTPHATRQYYPLVHTTFWAEYHLWKLDPLGYHLVNVLLHIGGALLFWAVLRRLGLAGAYAAALLFAVHPVMVESAGWITELKNVLSLVLGLSALLAYLRFDPSGFVGVPDAPAASAPPRRWGFYALAMLLFVGALLSKTVVCTLPAILFLIGWWKRGKLSWARCWPLLPMLAVGGAFGAVTAWLEKTNVGAEGAPWALSPWGHVLLAGRIPWFYLGKLLWPSPLIFFYERWQIDPTQWWQYLFPAALAGLLAALWLLRRRIGRGPLAAVLCFGVILFPALGFFNVYPMRFSYVADHFQYHASLAIFALMVAVATALVRRAGHGPKGPPARLRPAPPWREASGGRSETLVSRDREGLLRTPDLPKVRFRMFLGAGLTCVAAAILGALTWQQGHDYKDVRTLWTNTVGKNPTSPDAFNNLACVQIVEANAPTSYLYDEAIQNLGKAIQLNPDFADAYYNRGNAYNNMGRYVAAIGEFDKSIRIRPDYADAYNFRGNAYYILGRYEPAIRDFSKAIQLRSEYWLAHNNRGNVYNSLGRYDDAIQDYDAAIAMKPDYEGAYNNRGQVYGRLGRHDAAIRDYDKAIALKADYADAYANRGFAYGSLGRYGDAIRDYDKAIALRPDFADAYNNRGAAHNSLGRYDAAIRDYDKAIALKPDYAPAYNNRAVAYFEMKAYDQAWADVKMCRSLGASPNRRFLEDLAKSSGRSE
jgi:tetratricopeptide (TPR) repeat protein